CALESTWKTLLLPLPLRVILPPLTVMDPGPPVNSREPWLRVMVEPFRLEANLIVSETPAAASALAWETVERSVPDEPSSASLGMWGVLGRSRSWKASRTGGKGRTWRAGLARCMPRNEVFKTRHMIAFL